MILGIVASSISKETGALLKPSWDIMPDDDATSKYVEANAMIRHPANTNGWTDIDATSSVSTASDTGSWSVYITGTASSNRSEWEHVLVVGNSYQVRWKAKVDSTSALEPKASSWTGLSIDRVDLGDVTGWQQYEIPITEATATAALFRFYVNALEVWIDDLEIINYGVIASGTTYEYPNGDATSKWSEADNITENTVAPGWEDISLTELSVSTESDTGTYSMYISGDAENDRVEYHHTLVVGNSYEVKWKGKVDATSTNEVNCHLWEGLILTATVHMDLVTGWQDYTSGVIVATATAGLFRFYCDAEELWIDDVEIINYGVL